MAGKRILMKETRRFPLKSYVLVHFPSKIFRQNNSHPFFFFFFSPPPPPLPLPPLLGSHVKKSGDFVCEYLTRFQNENKSYHAIAHLNVLDREVVETLRQQQQVRHTIAITPSRISTSTIEKWFKCFANDSR